MKRYYTIQLDGNSLRFTPDGKVAVLDAIQALSGSDRAQFIWKEIRTACPYIARRCHDYVFPENVLTEVVDNEGWEKIEDVLIDYLLDNGLVV
jgi:hypothetical protein